MLLFLVCSSLNYPVETTGYLASTKINVEKYNFLKLLYLELAVHPHNLCEFFNYDKKIGKRHMPCGHRHE